VASKSHDCPLCGKQTEYNRFDVDRDVHYIECARCGRFSMTFEATTIELTTDQKNRLSAFCRRTGTSDPPALIKSGNIETLISTLPTFGPIEKLDNLLLLLAERTKQVGQDADFDVSCDYPLLISTPDELAFLMDALKNSGFVQARSMDSGDHVTMRGWERVQQIQKSGRDSKRTFVAMWFDPTMDETYDHAIAPAIIKAGYMPLRIDRHPHVNRIDDEIIGQIKRCRFMVADFTGQRHSVYFEAGMMIGLGRNVIWMCKEDELSELKFDVRQFSFIAYKGVADAMKLLYDKILAIEGEGPTKSIEATP
jgi:hypothetical protein